LLWGGWSEEGRETRIDFQKAGLLGLGFEGGKVLGIIDRSESKGELTEDCDDEDGGGGGCDDKEDDDDDIVSAEDAIVGFRGLCERRTAAGEGGVIG
jgi:hypothetical protein